MIEPAMYLGIGFLIASLLGLVFIPLVHARAVRLTMRRMEAATPLSMAEIQADKDQLRAEFAMSTRRLEMSVEQLKQRTTSQLTELGKKTDAISRMKLDLGEKAAAVFAMEAREKSLRDQIRATEEELAAKTTAMHQAERALVDKQADLAKLTHELSERTFLTDSQRIEIVALRTQVEALRGQVERFDTDIKQAEHRLGTERAEAETATKELNDERTKAQTLGVRVGELEQQLIAQSTEAQALGRRVLDLEQRLTEQGRLLADRDFEVTQLRGELETARRIETDLRVEIVAAENRHTGNNTRLRSENAVLEQEIIHARNERAAAQRELAEIKREAESSWATERVENALLRERINDIATEVARLTMVHEGPGSPIETMLSADTGRGGNSDPRHRIAETAPAAANGGDSLADRIRALQARASRISPAAS
jgi:chromosome segregation ATPase